VHTDQTQFDIPAPTEPHPTYTAATGIAPGEHQPIELAPGPHRSRPLLAVAIVVAAAILTFFGARTVADLDDAAPATDESVELDEAFAGASPDTSIPAEGPATDVPVNEAPDPVAPEPVPEQEDESGDGVDPEPAGPCDLLAPGQVLAVTPGPVQLPVGTYAGELIITNCGDEPVQWSAHTLAPSVTLGVAGGVLAGGADVDLQFAVDPAAIVGSAMAFTIHVAEPGFDTAVMVQVTKPMLNPGVVLPNVPLQMGE
jgi:hypothetical protein